MTLEMGPPNDNFVLIVAPPPHPDSVVEGWMSRIRAVDGIFQDHPRVYLNFSPAHDAFAPPRVSQVAPSVWEYLVNPNSFLHAEAIGNLIFSCRLCYVHTVHLARFVLGYYCTGKIITDFHGIVPEEELMLGNPEAAVYYAGIEAVVCGSSRRIVVVTEAMKDHLLAKYPHCAAEFIVLPIIEDHRVDLSEKLAPGSIRSDGPATAIYAGGTQTWQNIDLMAEACIGSQADCRFVFLSHNIETIKAKAGGLGERATFASIRRADIAPYYLGADFGFVLRDDVAVNRVACPTKLSEYMQFGIIPIVKSPSLGDFDRHGYEYVTHEEFVAGLVPGAKQRRDMALKNLDVLARLQALFLQSSRLLNNLVLPTELERASYVALPSGGRNMLFPSQCELYLFADQQTYKSKVVIGPYTEQTFDLGEAVEAASIRVVPALLDFAAENLVVTVGVDGAEGPEPTGVVSRAKPVGGRQVFNSEAPYFEIHFPRRTRIRSVRIELQFDLVGPEVWKMAALRPTSPDGGLAPVRIVMQGTRRSNAYNCLPSFE